MTFVFMYQFSFAGVTLNIHGGIIRYELLDPVTLQVYQATA